MEILGVNHSESEKEDSDKTFGVSKSYFKNDKP